MESLEIKIVKKNGTYEVVVSSCGKVITKAETPYFSAIKHYLFGVLNGIEEEMKEKALRDICYFFEYLRKLREGKRHEEK